MVISELIDTHLPDQEKPGITLPAPYQEEEPSMDRLASREEMVKWLRRMRIDVWMIGQPIGKGRPRFTRQGRAYTPAKTKD